MVLLVEAACGMLCFYSYGYVSLDPRFRNWRINSFIYEASTSAAEETQDSYSRLFAGQKRTTQSVSITIP